MRHNEEKDKQLQDSQTNCNQCVIKKRGELPLYRADSELPFVQGFRKSRGTLRFQERKTSHPRMTTSIPAFISGGSVEEKLPIGSIVDISLGGLLISIPREMKHKVLTDPHMTEFEIITTLPDRNQPIRLKCKSRRVVHHKDNIHVGASIIH